VKLQKWGIEFDFQPVVGMLHALLGLSLIGLTFFIGRIGWWNIPYALVTVLYLSTADYVLKRFLTC